MSAAYTLVTAESVKSEKFKTMRRNNPLLIYTISKVIPSMGNFSIQYNFQAIAVSLMVMSVKQCTSTEAECMEGKQAHWVAGAATATVFAGAMLGQLTMGYLGDVLDRNKAMILTLSVASLAAMCSAVLPQGTPTSVYIIIIVCRFILGAGVGGVYPLSAAKAVEDGNKEKPSATNTNLEGSSAAAEMSAADSLMAGSRRSALAFFWQVPGSMTPWALAYVFSYLSLSVDLQWRLLLGIGSIPATCVVALSMIEAKYSNQSKEDRGDPPVSDVNTRADLCIDEDKKAKLSATFHAAFRDRVVWFKVLYTGGGWFLFDVCFYGVQLFGGEIVASISAKSSESISSPSRLRNTSMKQVFALGLGIPAVAVSILLLRPLGTKNTQTAGFLLIAFSFTLIAAVYETLLKAHPNILYGIYCLVLFSVSGGPAVTSFVLPAETFPKEIRATFGGIAAACGKLGAFVGAYLFGPLASVTSYPCVMAVCAVLSLLGALLTHTCVGAEGPLEDQHCTANNTTAVSSGGIETDASDCTVSLMHSQGLNGSDTSPRHTTPANQTSNHITADSAIDEEAATGPLVVTI